MKFDVLKEFDWNGKRYTVGDVIEIPDDSQKIGSMTRSKFIRVSLPSSRSSKPAVKQEPNKMKVAEIAVQGDDVVNDKRSPKDIIAEAKAKANSK